MKRLEPILQPQIRKIRLRKLWIAYGMAPVSNVFIDEGAANALFKGRFTFIKRSC